MNAECLAAVKVAPSTMELRRLPLPDVRRAGGLLRVEASGVCGADVSWYASGALPSPEPVILGHHVVGTVEAISEPAAAALGLAPGDRVLVEEYLPCGTCVPCRAGEPRLCPASAPTGDTLRVGSTPVSVGPGLWGGYSQYLYLAERAMTHRLPPDLPTQLATLVFPLANGITWVRAAGAGPGDCVVVVGPGQMGLSCVVAARAAGAAHVAVLGRAGDEARLALAERLGAHHATTDPGELRRAVADATGGRMAAAVVDTASGAAETIDLAADLLGFGGTLALAQWPAGRTGLDLPGLARKRLTVTTVRGRDGAAIPAAIDLAAEEAARFAPLCSGIVDLAGVHDVLAALGSAAGRADLIHVSVRG
ncbi:alcohol dehydrogenase catalytic domain-containing protein [Phytohabitans sp. ZYX-F-186]|uniref:Alcohol dehydrogenase catalytic domain-containing protein n=1 Tax=Phytohabitans maris TaxID=3071409 RepID=A0ABU0Z969_9ACTN|nr:alcohol dehydrogenase catalytic domain-containing protein [Phytohabitans sp. ZYX-F-186]MDQ7903596.1 alcohol dehydrogenase catalytic domain-containing protein [Phytohabitans sp. ZYX-F-186]